MTTSISAIDGTAGGFYDRTTAHKDKHYDKHLFIAGRILQAAEMNEIQANAQTQLKGVADALFKDGDIVRDCRVAIDDVTGIATLEAGAIYIKGQVRGVAERLNLVVPKTGSVSIGIWLTEDVVTRLDDPTLVDPASGTKAFNEEGAYRLRLVPTWGLSTDVMAGAEFFPVYYVDSGVLRAKEPPPNLDAVTQAIARYDVDSNGSNYIVNGFRVMRLPDGPDPTTGVMGQIYSVAAGRARVNGFSIATNSARRVYFPAVPDTKRVRGEYFDVSAPDASGKQWVSTRRSPISRLGTVMVQRKVTKTVNRTPGTQTDTIPMGADESYYSMIQVSDTTGPFTLNTDYTVANGDIVWAAPGTAGVKAPSSGSSYSVECVIRTSAQTEGQTDTGFFVRDVHVAPNSVEIEYFFKLPRIDRLYVTEEGKFDVLIGIATDVNPASPVVPNTLLSIAQIHQAWTSDFDDTYVVNDGVRMVSMSTIEAMNSRMDDLTDMVAQLNLVSDVNIRDASKKLGLFVDPFVNDEQRDQGIAQTAAITGGCLQLPIAGTPLYPDPAAINVAGVQDIIYCNGQDEVILGNTARTESMKVNPYTAFAPFPAQVVVNPQIDRWVDTTIQWTSPETRYFTTTVYAPWSSQWGMHLTQNYVTGQTYTNELAGTSTADAEFLRELDVAFTLKGFASNESLTSILFDDKELLP
ncbi:DUF4815 domain-containing protein [Salmonella enterica]|nr:DUF4815 domain-containing protein [Salmonella enterica]EAO0118548.1 DUF4815 domain-containing protein [Salmonella enterica]EAO3601653.1 DUF4815 domain-containing protein [Salmonella enterica]EAR6391546.1 DUF4815 domain-containing protein [Salmonella enterica]EAV1285310.1 DUF4815 domain-containing protein [Salmonella enterica]